MSRISLGAELIQKERSRQIKKLDYSAEHDDISNRDDQLVRAAACYALPGRYRGTGLPSLWPWESGEWHPADASEGTPGRIKELAKAGALIAAEIDRLNRKYERELQEKELEQVKANAEKVSAYPETSAKEGDINVSLNMTRVDGGYKLNLSGSESVGSIKMTDQMRAIILSIFADRVLEGRTKEEVVKAGADIIQILFAK